MEMSALPPNVLVRIAELYDFWELKTLRLVNKEWRDAVGCAQIRLRPNKNLTGAQLTNVCSLFPRTSHLYLVSRNLTDASLDALQVVPHLTMLFLWCNQSITAAGFAHLALLGCLKTLNLVNCDSLFSWSASISSFSGLTWLCVHGTLASLPEEIRILTALKSLFVDSEYLKEIPAGIGSLASLSRLVIVSLASPSMLVIKAKGGSQLRY